MRRSLPRWISRRLYPHGFQHPLCHRAPGQRASCGVSASNRSAVLSRPTTVQSFFFDPLSAFGEAVLPSRGSLPHHRKISGTTKWREAARKPLEPERCMVNKTPLREGRDVVWPLRTSASLAWWTHERGRERAGGVREACGVWQGNRRARRARHPLRALAWILARPLASFHRTAAKASVCYAHRLQSQVTST
jgi:hypothetical protein